MTENGQYFKASVVSHRSRVNYFHISVRVYFAVLVLVVLCIKVEHTFCCTKVLLAVFNIFSPFDAFARNTLISVYKG